VNCPARPKKIWCTLWATENDTGDVSRRIRCGADFSKFYWLKFITIGVELQIKVNRLPNSATLFKRKGLQLIVFAFERAETAGGQQEFGAELPPENKHLRYNQPAGADSSVG
jgi:hypothetical protein